MVMEQETGLRSFELILRVREHEDKEAGDDGNFFVLQRPLIFTDVTDPIALKGFLTSFCERMFTDSHNLPHAKMAEIFKAKEDRIVAKRNAFLEQKRAAEEERQKQAAENNTVESPQEGGKEGENNG